MTGSDWLRPSRIGSRCALDEKFATTAPIRDKFSCSFQRRQRTTIATTTMRTRVGGGFGSFHGLMTIDATTTSGHGAMLISKFAKEMMEKTRVWYRVPFFWKTLCRSSITATPYNLTRDCPIRHTGVNQSINFSKCLSRIERVQ
jgi:hypothetical protein